MKKLILALLLVITGIGIFYSAKRVFNREPTPGAMVMKPSLDYEIGACENNTREGLEGNIDVSEISNGSFDFNQRLVTYCNANEDNLRLELKVDRAEFIIREIFEADMVVKCICPLKINGTVSGVEKGKEYKVRFVFENRYTHSEDVLDEIIVN